MDTVKELFARLDRDRVVAELEAYYEDQGPNHDGHVGAWDVILTLEPRADPDLDGASVVVTLSSLPGEEDSYVDVHGVRPGDDSRFALEFTPWEDWLPLTVVAKGLGDVSEERVAAHLLYEMTYLGFDQQTVAEAGEELDAAVAQLKRDIDTIPDDASKEDVASTFEALGLVEIGVASVAEKATDDRS